MNRTLLLLLTAISVAAPVRESGMPLLQDAVSWPEPTAATPLRVNPPTFRWPAADAREFEWELSRSPEFRDPIRARIATEYYRPLHSLAPGRWHWRVRAAGGQWMKPASFEISPDLPRWDLPDWDQLISRVPAAHPRIYLRPDEVQSYRAKAAGPLRDFVRQWAGKEARLIGVDLEPKPEKKQKAPAAGDSGEDAFRAAKMDTWADKAGAGNLMRGSAELAWLYMLTREDRFADEAKRRVLRATRMDPEKELSDSVSDFANANIVTNSAVVYDMLYDRLSQDERTAIRSMLTARLQPIMRKLERSPRRLFVAHGWQHVYLNGIMGALAIYGEEPRARRWLLSGLQAFVALYPWYGGVDGGSAEGTNYYTCCDMLSSLDTRDVFQAAFGIDFARQNPWYRANPFYLIYALPPGGTRSLFGDLNPLRADETPIPQHHLAAARMASLYRNGYAADYARRVPGNPLGDPLQYFRWSGQEPVAAESMEKLPPAHAFRDIGMAYFHSAITRPEENVRLEFRSSPYGSVGHSHADQNSFNIIAYNEPLIIDSGYYTAAGDRHHAGWTRQTKAHNTILVDGMGQARKDGAGPLFHGEITGFEQGEDWAHVSGSAAPAYEQVKLARFDRHIVWLRGEKIQTYVVMDDVEPADRGPHRFDWLLHAAQEMKIDRDKRSVTLRTKHAEAQVSLLEPADISFAQTSKFDAPPEDWRGRGYDYKDQWHVSVTSNATGRVRYAAVVQVAHPGAAWAQAARAGNSVRVGKWTVAIEDGQAKVGHIN